jgi:hypothetical protein
MQDLYGHSPARTSFTLIIGCGMALLLGVIGIDGVISYAPCDLTLMSANAPGSEQRVPITRASSTPPKSVAVKNACLSMCGFDAVLTLPS